MSQTITIGKRTVTMHQFTGKVVSSSKNMETKVHGGGGGGYSYQGTGGSAPVTISSTTVIHDQLFLVDKEGNERALQLTGFDLACRESNIVTAMWAITSGEERGPYFAIINHSTGEQYINKKIIKEIIYKCTRPININNPALGCLTLIGILVVLAIVFWPLAIAFLGYAVYYEVVIVKKNVKLFNDSIVYPTVEKW
jgi:hypothetical protein